MPDGVTRTWDVLSNHPDQTITHAGEFYNAFCERYGDDITTRGLLGNVFCEHGMDTTVGCGIVSVEDDRDESLPLTLCCRPNPARGGTRLAFSLSGDAVGAVRLCVYDVGGRLVRDLLDQLLTAGHHAIVWNGQDGDGVAVRAGLYFCRLVTRAGTSTASVLILH